LWLLNAGVAYDSGFQDTHSVSPVLPAGWAWRFGVGAQYAAKQNLDVGFSFEYLYGGDLEVNQQGAVRGTVVGSYDAVSTLFFAGYLNWR
jgi:long-chain fatty acid transport protein